MYMCCVCYDIVDFRYVLKLFVSQADCCSSKLYRYWHRCCNTTSIKKLFNWLKNEGNIGIYFL